LSTTHNIAIILMSLRKTPKNFSITLATFKRRKNAFVQSQIYFRGDKITEVKVIFIHNRIKYAN
jgi:hypothetical protein